MTQEIPAAFRHTWTFGWNIAQNVLKNSPQRHSKTIGLDFPLQWQSYRETPFFGLGRSHRTRFISGALPLHPRLELRAKKMRQTWSHALCWSLCLPIHFSEMQEKKTRKKTLWIIMKHQQSLCYRPSEHVIRGVSTHQASLMRLELAAN